MLASQSINNILPSTLGLTADHLAYVIYTSGSTGEPKGVMIPHRGLNNIIADNGERFQLESGQRFLQNISMSFDAATWVIFMTLVRGAGLVIAKELLVDSDELQQLICQQKISHLMMIPSSLNLLDPVRVPNLRCVIVGGDNCSQALADRWNEHFLFFNAYGPTENSICSTVKQISTGDTVNIGQLVQNCQGYVLNSSGEMLPTGVAGELHVGGAGLARGYLNRPKLTAEKFIINPMSTDSNERLYKTGDRVRWLFDGNIEYLGRIDDQVKIRGFRIELGEIENTLLTHDSIKEVVVTAREDQSGDKRLIAYIVSQDTSAQGILVSSPHEVWRKHLNQTMPEYMVPSAFILLDALPLTPNGKIDRKALPAPEMLQLEGEYIAPNTETEKVLCVLWQEILAVEKIGMKDNFFRLGGHSLLATQLLARINQSLEINLKIKDVFSMANVFEMSVLIEKHLMQKKELLLEQATENEEEVSW